MNNNFDIIWRFQFSDHILTNKMLRANAMKALGASDGEKIQKAEEFIKFDASKPYVVSCAQYGLDELEYGVQI